MRHFGAFDVVHSRTSTYYLKIFIIINYLIWFCLQIFTQFIIPIKFINYLSICKKYPYTEKSIIHPNNNFYIIFKKKNKNKNKNKNITISNWYIYQNNKIMANFKRKNSKKSTVLYRKNNIEKALISQKSLK